MAEDPDITRIEVKLDAVIKRFDKIVSQLPLRTTDALVGALKEYHGDEERRKYQHHVVLLLNILIVLVLGVLGSLWLLAK
jgi:hypothetical protein